LFTLARQCYTPAIRIDSTPKTSAMKDWGAGQYSNLGTSARLPHDSLLRLDQTRLRTTRHL
jgi:hypothetical protein